MPSTGYPEKGLAAGNALYAMESMPDFTQEERAVEDAEHGVWLYSSASLCVQIRRVTTDKPKRIWYEAEVWTDGSEIPHMIANNPEKRMRMLEYPYKIARKNQTVFAVNSDFAHLRISNKSNPGTILRAGEIIARHKGRRTYFPPLDTLAIFPDGTMQVFDEKEHTPEEYQEMGAYDVLAFGAWLIRDGQLNEKVMKYTSSKAQRTAVGMIEPNHYLFIMIEGRHNGSTGASIQFVAQLMADRGCVTAMNLDGGQSSSIVFMGKQICTQYNSKGKRVSARKAAEILGIGTSSLVCDMDAPLSDRK